MTALEEGGYRPFRWSRWQYALAAAVYFAGISLLSAHVPARVFDLLPDLEVVQFLRRMVTNLAHVPLFGGFAFFLVFAVSRAVPPFHRRRAPYVVTFLLTCAFGCVDEVHQAFVPGRFPSHIDIGLDAVGGLCALSFVARRASAGAGGSPYLRDGGLVLVAVVLGVLAVVEGHQSTLPWRRAADWLFPVPDSGLVEGFERADVWRGAGPREARLRPEDFEIEPVTDWKTQGEKALRVEVPVADWAGITTREVPVDWTGFSALRLDVHIDAGSPVRRIGFRIVDYDRETGEVRLPVEPGEQTIVADLARFSGVDLGRVDALCVLVRGHGERVAFTVDRLALEIPLEKGEIMVLEGASKSAQATPSEEPMNPTASSSSNARPETFRSAVKSGLLFVAAGCLSMLALAGCASTADEEDPEDPAVKDRNRERRLDVLRETDKDRLFKRLDNEVRTWQLMSTSRESQQTLSEYLTDYVTANRSSILAELQSDIPQRRTIAAGALYFIDDPIVVGPLVGLLEDPEPSVVGNALMALSVNANDRVPRDKVIALSMSEHLEVRQNAILVLGELAGGKDADSVISVLSKALEDEKPAVRYNAVRALGRARVRGALPALVKALDDPWPGIRAHACLSLAAIGDKTAIDPLKKALADNSELVRAAAQSALEVLDPEMTYTAPVPKAPEEVPEG